MTLGSANWKLNQNIKDKILAASPGAVNTPKPPVDLIGPQINTGDNSTLAPSLDIYASNSTRYGGSLPPGLNEDIMRGPMDTDTSELPSSNNSTPAGHYQTINASGAHGINNASSGNYDHSAANSTHTGFNNKINSGTHWKSDPNAVYDSSVSIDPGTKKQIWTTDGGQKSYLNLKVNPNLGSMLDTMEMQRVNLPGLSGGNFDPITGKPLKPASGRPGEQLFKINDYTTGESRNAYYNIGKNTDAEQHQAALNRQSQGQFENYIQKTWHKGATNKNLNQGSLDNVLDKIENSNLTEKQKKKLEKEYMKKATNYQVAIGGFGTANPWSYTVDNRKNANKNNEGPGWGAVGMSASSNATIDGYKNLSG